MMCKTIIISAILNILIVSEVHGTSISNLNVIFETFSPTSMVRFFEFNDIGWNISEKCIKDMFLYLDGLHKDVLWASKLYDSSGYYAGGIYAGNNLRHGDPQLCRELNNDYNYHEYRLKYGANLTVHEDVQTYLIPSAVLPFRVRLVNARYKTIVESSSFHSYIIHQTACMPISCAHNDLLQVMSYANVSHLRNNLIMKNAQLLDIRILKQSYRPNMDISFHWFIAITAVFLFLGLFGTVLEYCMNFDVKINLMKVEHKNTINATAAQITNRLNGLTHCPDKYCQNTPHNMIDQLSSTNSNSIQDMSLLQFKEFKVENFSTISVDLVRSKCSQCSQCSEYFPTKQIRIDTQRFHHYSDPNSFGGTTLDTTILDCGWLRQFLLAFSWRRNYETLFSASPKDCISEPFEISGLRVFALLWMLMVHVCTVLYFVSDNKMYRTRHGFNVVHDFIAHGILAFDFHFFLCGICIAHMFFKRIQRFDVERICSCFDTFVHIIVMIMYKVFNMTLPYLITLILLQICMKYFHDFSIIDIPTLDHKTCEQNMWHNIFFIDQFYPLEQRCMIWSWVLSVEVQCFIVASVILLISTAHPRFGIIIFSSFLICSIVAMTTVNVHGHGTSVNSSLIVHENLAFFNSLYENPWARISPYIFGICIGYVLHRISGKIEISLIVITCGWIACCFLAIALILSKLSGTSSSSSAAFSTITYAMWTLIVLWLIIASISKHRGVIGRLLTSKYLLPFNKISNCFLMLHPLVTRIIILSSDTAVHLSFAMIVTFYLGVAMITIFFSFLLYIIYGAPINELLRIVYNRNIKY